MNNIFLPLVYLLINLVFGLSLLMFSHRILSSTLRKKLGILPQSLVFNILAGAVMLSLAMLISQGSGPMISMIQHFTQHQNSGWILRSAVYLLGFYSLSCAFAYLTIAGSVQIFHRLTGDLDENIELAQGNAGVALLLGILILSITMLIKSPLVALFEALIPYPDLSYGVF